MLALRMVSTETSSLAAMHVRHRALPCSTMSTWAIRETTVSVMWDPILYRRRLRWSSHSALGWTAGAYPARIVLTMARGVSTVAGPEGRGCPSRYRPGDHR